MFRWAGRAAVIRDLSWHARAPVPDEVAVVRALVLDVGGVVIRTPFELLDVAERRRGLDPGTLGPRGPFDPDGDHEFDRVRDGTLAERAYWQQRADRAAPVLDVPADIRSFMDVLYEAPPDEVVRPEVAELIDDVVDAGIPLGLLTNDLYDFHGTAWVERMGVFARADVLVDVSRHGVLKPDPQAFRLGIDAMGLPAEELLFLDDQPANAAGARAAGMGVIEVDVTRPGEAVAHARTALELTWPLTPH